ncbi:MAG TPA: glycoside hydrolase family 130 protein [Acidobacteriaceae bacterium]|jgi:predicted GH43/DUF377 family glycosyl hydrolase|nr:glycoside hydrolase family 130 protein [Acidobacteriaceae bacterium]
MAILRPVLAGIGLLCLAAGCTAQSWVIGPWTRASQEPVIRPRAASVFHDPVTGRAVHWEALHTFNPAAVVRDRKVMLLYRAEDDSGSMTIGGHTSRLGMAASTDGVHFTRMPVPVLYPARDAQMEREWPGGVEDPRLVESEGGTYVLTYTQWSRTKGVYTIGIATSKDLVHWKKHGPALGTAGKYASWRYKSAGIVTQVKNGRLIAAKIGGRYWMYWGEVEVHVASSPDLVHWTPVENRSGEPVVVLKKRPDLSDSGFPETGPPAVLTKRGIVLLYNAKNATHGSMDTSVAPGAYSVQEALFDACDPSRSIARTEKPVFAPTLAWEKSGQYAAGTTFAEGLVLFRGKWWLYYGAADTFVGAATAPVKSSELNLPTGLSASGCRHRR